MRIHRHDQPPLRCAEVAEDVPRTVGPTRAAGADGGGTQWRRLMTTCRVRRYTDSEPSRSPEAFAVTHPEPRPRDHRGVQVQLDDGRWVDGILQYGREDEGVWSWFVRCDVGSGITRLDWFQEPRIWSVE